MLAIPWVVGWGIAGGRAGDQLLLLVAVVSLFLAHTHLMSWARERWAARPDPRARALARRLVLAFGGIALAAGAPLAWPRGAWGPLVFALLASALTASALALVRRRLDRGHPGQLLAAVGLGLSAPAAYWVGTGRLDRTALALWLLNAAFFSGMVHCVRLTIEDRARRAPFPSSGAKVAFALPTLAIESLLVAVGLGAALLGGLSPAIAIAFAPLALQAIDTTIRLGRPRPLKQVGLIATAQSILFAALAVWLA